MITVNLNKTGIYKNNPETKKHLSEMNKGKERAEESRKKGAESNKGRIVSEETRRKISMANKGKKRNSAPWNKGLTKETNEKIRKGAEKMAISKMGISPSDEAREKMSDSAKRAWIIRKLISKK